MEFQNQNDYGIPERRLHEYQVNFGGASFWLEVHRLKIPLRFLSYLFWLQLNVP